MRDLLAGNCRLFAEEGAAAREDPAGTFALSRPVRHLDYFVSHAWRTSRWSKYFALLFYFNQERALVAYFLAIWFAC